ncbi:MAG: hypothetical protein R2748_01275 [Bryobacterales bacterium]
MTVYCRTNNVATREKTYRGVRLVHLPTIPHKYFDTLAHTGFATLDLLFRRADVALYCNGANAVYTWMPRLAGIPTALNVDGLERQRKKWNALARSWYGASGALVDVDADRDDLRRASDRKVLPGDLRQGLALHRIRFQAAA